MEKYLIEVPHDKEHTTCPRVAQIFMDTGSHFLTHANWGCTDGEHKAWIVAEVESKDEARSILPPPLRAEAKIIRLNSFTVEEAEEILHAHPQP
jgi:hypothetical protein